MKQKFIKIFLLFFPLLLLAGIFSSRVALAQSATEKQRCDKFATYFKLGNNTSLVEGLPQFCSVSQFVAWLLDKLFFFAGTVTVVFIVFGGFSYITAAGNEEQSEQAKKILINSVIGLIVIIMAGAIVRIVSGTLKNNSTTYNGAVISRIS
ncbi:MAG: hypothetical protein JNN11_00600 [Candidatus Doudnabacteria bacterium]|nr:hypothetical protein [Candidatus Doudnabacteria bacterium]